MHVLSSLCTSECFQQSVTMQAELRTCKAKVKLKGQMASQQDNLLVERQTSIDRTMQENNNLKQEIAVMKDDNESMRKKVEFYCRKITALVKHLIVAPIIPYMLSAG